MNSVATYNTMFFLIVSCALFFATASAVPLESEEEQSENALVSRPEAVDMADMAAPWDPITAAALRKLLLQLDAEERLTRVGRSWPQNESRGWGVRAMDGRLARQWRADKRQVRFRQCYFNPISCFRK